MDLNAAGVGWAIFDPSNNKSDLSNRSLESVVSPLQAESLAIRSAIDEAQQRGVTKLWIESDSKSLVTAIRKESHIAKNRTQVPKFGEWDKDVPLTVVFEKAASKNKSKKDTNMCNPTEYPEMNRKTAQTRNYRSHDQPPNHKVRQRHERFSSREETEFRPFTPSPVHNERNIRVKPPPLSESYNNQSYGGITRSVGNPSEINRWQPHDLGPVQSRPIPNLRNRSSDKVATIPPFPGSGSNVESYTLIFDKVKEERNQVKPSDGTIQSTPTRPINDHQHHQPLPSSPKGCCFFAWDRKRSY